MGGEQFKVGDKIEMIEDYEELKKGEVHEIICVDATPWDVDGDLYYVASLDPGTKRVGMYAKRFRRAPRTFAMGDDVRVIKARPDGQFREAVGLEGTFLRSSPSRMKYECAVQFSPISVLSFPADCLEHVAEPAPAVDPRDARIAELEARIVDWDKRYAVNTAALRSERDRAEARVKVLEARADAAVKALGGR